MLPRGPLLFASLASLALGCALDPEIDTLFGPSNTFAVRPPGGSSSSSSSSSSASSPSSGGGAGGEGAGGFGGQGGATASSSSSSSSSGTGGQGGEGGSGPVCLTCWEGWEAAVWKSGGPPDWDMCSPSAATKMWELKKCACTTALGKGCEEVCNGGNVHPTEAQIAACSTAASLFCVDAHAACKQAP